MLGKLEEAINETSDFLDEKIEILNYKYINYKATQDEIDTLHIEVILIRNELLKLVDERNKILVGRKNRITD